MLVSLAKMVFIATDSNKSDQGNYFQKGGVDVWVLKFVLPRGLLVALSRSLLSPPRPSRPHDSRAPGAAEAGDTCQQRDSVSTVSASPLSPSLRLPFFPLLSL